MKIILTQEVSGLGIPGDIVELKNGYGRNYLLPQGFAIQWSKGAEKQVAVIKRAREAREIRDLGQANEVKARFAGQLYVLGDAVTGHEAHTKLVLGPHDSDVRIQLIPLTS